MKVKGIIILGLVLIILLSGTAFGNDNQESLWRETVAVNQMENSEESQSTEEETPAHRINNGDENMEIGKIDQEKPNFIMKLGTFLLIVVVLLFLIQWRHQKNKEK